MHIEDLNNTKKILSSDYLGFSRDDLNDFNQFYYKAIKVLSSLLSKEIDDRKKKLFKLIHSSKGENTVRTRRKCFLEQQTNQPLFP